MITDVYDSKNNACNSPYIIKRGLLWYRWHPGFGRDIPPSWALMGGDEQVKAEAIEACIKANRRNVFL